MGKLQFGTYDLFQGNIIEEGPEPVDYCEQYIKEVRLAESLGFEYNSVIEHQGNNNVPFFRGRSTWRRLTSWPGRRPSSIY